MADVQVVRANYHRVVLYGWMYGALFQLGWTSWWGRITLSARAV